MRGSDKDILSHTMAKPFRRYLAALIDYALLMSVTNLIYIAANRGSWVVILFVVLWFLYFPFLESLSGQTPAKRLFRLRVLRSDFTPPNLFDTFVRHLFDIIDFLPALGLAGLVIAMKDKHNQRFGDKAARTVVVQTD